MTLQNKHLELGLADLPSVRVARITIDSISNLDSMLQPGIRFGVTVRNISDLVGTPIAYIQNFYFTVDVMDGDERFIIQKMENWRNGTYKAFYRIFYDGVCETRLDGVYGVELGWRNFYDIYPHLTPEIGAGAILNLDARYTLETGYYQISDEEAPNYAPSVVPANLRVKSLILTFLVGINRPAAYQFIDSSTSSFTNPGSWKKLAYFTDIPSMSLIAEMASLNRAVWNASKEGETTNLATATAACPADVRKMGLNIILKNSAEKWETWQFIGTNIHAQFEDVAYWQRVDTAQNGIINLTEKVPPSDDWYTLSSYSEALQYAPAYVPVNVRKEGLIITFQSYSEWETWQFTGPLANFSAAGNWKRIDPFIATGVYDADAQMPLGVGEYYQISNDDDSYYLPSLIPVDSRVAFMKVKFINSSGRSVIMRYLHHAFDYFNNYDHWEVLQMGGIDNVSLQKMLTGHVETHYHDTVQTGRVIPVTAVSAPIARTFSLDPTVSGEGYMIIPESYSFGSTITIELTLSYLLQARFYKYVLYIDMRHAGPLDLTITKNVGNIILKGGSTLNIALAKGIYKIEFIRQMSDVSNLVLYARHDFIPDDI